MSKDKHFYFRALEAAVKEYDRLKAQREDIETRLAQLRQTIASLAPLCERPQSVHLDEIGLTEACRTVLRASFSPLTPVHIREGVAGLGVDLATYSNPLASIHTILKRLIQAGEVRQITSKGKTVYWWKRPITALVVPAGGPIPSWWPLLEPVKPKSKKEE